MTRYLAINERTVDAAARATYQSTLAARRAAAKTAGVEFWVFEHTVEHGRFIEFSEGADAQSVTVATSQAHPSALWRQIGVD